LWRLFGLLNASRIGGLQEKTLCLLSLSRACEGKKEEENTRVELFTQKSKIGNFEIRLTCNKYIVILRQFCDFVDKA